MVRVRDIETIYRDIYGDSLRHTSRCPVGNLFAVKYSELTFCVDLVLFVFCCCLVCVASSLVCLYVTSCVAPARELQL